MAPRLLGTALTDFISVYTLQFNLSPSIVGLGLGLGLHFSLRSGNPPQHLPHRYKLGWFSVVLPYFEGHGKKGEFVIFSIFLGFSVLGGPYVRESEVPTNGIEAKQQALSFAEHIHATCE